jgi:L-alanine-DL-glutamate epimerase-like enolase superfamily enzyme
MLEAIKIHAVCQQHRIPSMMGGMLESRIALTAFVHFALAHDNIIFYDMDTCLLGHKIDPVKDGVRFRGYFLEIPELPGIGADADNDFLATQQKITI